MVEVKEVRTRKERREFLSFANKLYKGNKNYVPPLYSDEKKIFRSDYVYYDTCEAVYFNAYRDGKMAGRISGIIQKAANEKYNEATVRFTRFDAVDDAEVARKLFEAVENWGRQKKMKRIVGPLGFSDLEREGLLIHGFDCGSTFEEQYNAEYYQRLIEPLGYEKDVDWIESRIKVPEKLDESYDKLSEAVLRRSGLHWGEAKNVNEFIKKYADGFFHVLDRSYEKLYGTVPFTENMKKMMLDNFRLIIQLKFVSVVVDDHDEVKGLAICFPAIGDALAGTDGKLYPHRLPKLFRIIRKPKHIDLGLIGVDPEYLNSGLSVCFIVRMAHMAIDEKIEYAETNLNLEDNAAIRNLWKRFDATENKRRRCYRKEL